LICYASETESRKVINVVDWISSVVIFVFDTRRTPEARKAELSVKTKLKHSTKKVYISRDHSIEERSLNRYIKKMLYISFVQMDVILP
jgi:hypothetical protein